MRAPRLTAVSFIVAAFLASPSAAQQVQLSADALSQLRASAREGCYQRLAYITLARTDRIRSSGVAIGELFDMLISMSPPQSRNAPLDDAVLAQMFQRLARQFSAHMERDNPFITGNRHITDFISCLEALDRILVLPVDKATE